jgi:hypothetical protein
MKNIVRAVGVAVAALSLSGCFLVPGKFVADVDIRKVGDFNVAYKGEVLFQMPDDMFGGKSAAKPWNDAFATCYASGRTSTDEFATAEMRASSADDSSAHADEDADQREVVCTAKQIAAMRAEYNETKKAAADKQAKEADNVAQLFGFAGAGDEANQKFAATLMKYEGWKSVIYRGKGVFDVDYRYAGKLTHDFIFPIFPKTDIIIPFVMIRKRADGAIAVSAPGLVGGGMKALASRAKSLGQAVGSKDMPEAPSTQGVLTITTDGEVLSNNTEDGPATVPTGKALKWEVSPVTERLPEALIKVK